MSKINKLQPYHYAWLMIHPERTESWLRERLSDGFHVHHINGDHDDNRPENLALIESRDHMALHGCDARGAIQKPPKDRPKKKPRWKLSRQQIKGLEEMGVIPPKDVRDRAWMAACMGVKGNG